MKKNCLAAHKTKVYSWLLCFALLLNLMPLRLFAAEAEASRTGDQAGRIVSYTVPVRLWKARSDSDSMGNRAFETEATVRPQTDGSLRYEVQVHGISLGPIYGHMWNLLVSQKDGSYKDAERVRSYMDKDLNGEQREFPQVYGFSLPSEGHERAKTAQLIPVKIWVDAMDMISSFSFNNYEKVTPGKGEQEARLRFDWSQARANVEEPEEEAGGDTEEESGSQPVLAPAPREAVKQDYYEVPVRLWHAYMDKASMGDAALVKTARAYPQAEGGMRYELSFQGLKFLNMYGHLWNFFSQLEGKEDAWQQAEILVKHMDKDLQGKQREFPYTYGIQRQKEKEERILVKVWVDAMDAIASGGATSYEQITPGKGEQKAYVVFDWAQARLVKQAEPTPSPTPEPSPTPAAEDPGT